MTKRLMAPLCALLLLAAGCNAFQQSLPVGMIKTVNGGADWQFSNQMKTGSATLAGQSIAKLDFDPANRQVVFAGSYTGGLYRSDDAGASWSNVLSKIYVYDFAISPTDSQTIYAAGFYADHGRVLKTTDGGASWNQIYNEESATNPVRALTLNPADSNQLIAGLASGSLVKSSDGGQSWQLLQNFKDQINRIFWRGADIYVLLKTQGLKVSGDGGQTFSSLVDSLSQKQSVAGISYSQNTVGSYSQAYVDAAAANLIYLTTDKGLYKSVDGGQSWQLQTLPVKPGAGSARAVTVAPSSSNVVMASVGNTIYKSLDGGQSWQTQSVASGGFVNYLLIDPQLPQIAYGGIYSSQ
ncbi:MAG TPA: hypothetical protein VHA30_01050 [Patescibacteria group bacterium]|nr:hypothetical protein [Patescibacteria group bacterium]